MTANSPPMNSQTSRSSGIAAVHVLPTRSYLFAWTIFVSFALLLAAAACTQAEEKASLDRADLGSVKPLHVIDGIYLAGQPATDDLERFKQRGVETVISLRPKTELDWDEAEAARQHGLNFHLIPFRKPDSLTDGVFDKVRRLLAARDGKPILLHCSSANRVGAVWIPYRVLDCGISYESALEEAKKIGLRTEPYIPKAKKYIQKQQRS
jgi:uncharacterized protein (TIGR01244 family)